MLIIQILVLNIKIQYRNSSELNSDKQMLYEYNIHPFQYN